MKIWEFPDADPAASRRRDYSALRTPRAPPDAPECGGSALGFSQELRGIVSLSGNEAHCEECPMKKLLLLSFPVLAIAGLQVWTQALAEPEPVHRPGIVVSGATVASPPQLQGSSRSAELRRGSGTVPGTSDLRGHDGR